MKKCEHEDAVCLTVNCCCDWPHYHEMLTFVHLTNHGRLHDKTTPTETLATLAWTTTIITVETLGVFNASACHLLADLGRRISINTGEARETSYLHSVPKT